VQTIRKHADVMLLLQYLVFAARVLYGVYLGVFSIFCKDRGLSKAPGCKTLMKHWLFWLCMDS
jgi:hypothetical protein